MGLLKRTYCYSRVEKEDPDKQSHQRAQLLISKTMEEASQQRSRYSFKQGKSGRQQKKLGKGVSRNITQKLKHWKRLLCRKPVVPQVG